MRPLILAQMNDSLAQLQPFEQVAQRKAQFEEFSNTPYFKSLPPQMQAAYAAQASGFAPVNTPQGALVPNKYQSRAEEQDPALLSRFGIAPDYKGPITISKDRLTNQIMDIVPGNPGLQLITNNDGTTSFVPKTPGATGGVAPAVATRVTNGGVDATGHTIFFNPLNPMGTHVTAPGVNASVLPTVTGHTSVTNPDGSVVSSTQRSKVLTPLVKPAVTAPGVKAAPSETPVPTGPGAPAVPTTTPLPPRASVPPFDPANRLDSLVQQIANGDTTLEKAKTNARDKFQIEDRMAQLGLTPANITTSMRERATNARNILKEMDRIDGIITQADKDGDLGVVATRWNDFLTNKLGSDPTKTQVFSKLSSDLGFLSTAVSMAHGGLRGGSSPTMVEHWEKALDAKDPATLKSKLGEARQWMEQYAQMDKGLKGQPITPLQAGGSVVSDLIKKYK